MHCSAQTYPELEVSPPVQAAALVGAGLLYQGTCHRRLSLSDLLLKNKPIAPSLNLSRH